MNVTDCVLIHDFYFLLEGNLVTLLEKDKTKYETEEVRWRRTVSFSRTVLFLLEG